jgi:hypothetical protein
VGVDLDLGVGVVGEAGVEARDDGAEGRVARDEGGVDRGGLGGGGGGEWEE